MNLPKGLSPRELEELETSYTVLKDGKVIKHGDGTTTYFSDKDIKTLEEPEPTKRPESRLRQKLIERRRTITTP